MNATKRESVADRIAESLRASILRGRLQPGDALPSERDLAEKYAANRSTVREAVRQLEAWGLVSVRHGGATRVREYLLSAGIDLVPHLFEAAGVVDKDVLRDLHECRAMILGWAAEQAAVRADPASVARLESLVRDMRSASEKPSRLQELDYDFFQALVDITGNRVLGLFANVVRDVYLAGRERFVSMYTPEAFDIGHHERLVAALRSRDPAAAAAAMRAHALSAMGRIA